MRIAAVGFTLAFLAAMLMTPLSSKLALKLGVLDRPDRHPGGRKRHSEPIPYLGGLAIFFGLLVSVLLLISLARIGSVPSARGLVAAVVIATALGLVGMADDIRPMSRWVRLAAQILAAVGAWQIGFRVEAVPWEPMNLFLTLLWIVGITNAFNLLDNMDGLSAGLAGIGAISFAAIALLENQIVLGVLAAALAGSSLGFLAHNRHPARVFMGDAGALFLGFLLAVIGVRLRFQNVVDVTFLVPVVVLGLPIFDTTLVVLSRLRSGRRPFTGARDHVSHRLVRTGLPIRATVGLLYWAALCLGWIGLVISRSSRPVGWMLLGFVAAMGLFFGALLWRVPTEDEISAGGAEPMT